MKRGQVKSRPKQKLQRQLRVKRVTSPAQQPRADWRERFRRSANSVDDELLLPDYMTTDFAWTW
jgi:hypothetical protein